MTEIAHLIVDTAGIGGAIVGGVFIIASAIYITATYWIVKGGEAKAESEQASRRQRWKFE